MRARSIAPDDVSTRLAERAIDALQTLLDALTDAGDAAFLDVARAHPKEAYASLTRALLDAITARLADATGLPWTARDAIEVTVDGVTASVSTARCDAVCEALTTLDGAPVSYASLGAEHLGAVYERLLSYSLTVSSDGALSIAGGVSRKRSGSHYTPRALAEAVVRGTLAPLLSSRGDPDAIVALRVCDPSMGAGAFLLETCRQLSEELSLRWRAEGRERTDLDARRAVASRCVHGVDLDGFAVELARRALWLWVGDAELPKPFADGVLREGNSLVGPSLEFEDVARRGGFDAIVGNPPWVSYAGRAAQPLDPALRRLYLASYASFHGYRNLQAMFVERAATIARPSGRIGLVLPSSMAELDGYGPSRAAHDRLAVCDDELPDLGEDGFLGVFQPSMVLYSTVRTAPLAVGSDTPWPIERPDVDDEAKELLALLSGPTFDPSVFGERGLQTSGDDVDHLTERPDASHTVALRVGSDIAAFRRGPPSLWADARRFGARLRAPEAWREVAVLIRQTARVPIAVRSDGEGFRNSILAGFERDGVTADLLVAYLNASVIRWRHYYSNRDARLGMPQVKIGHLRAIPAPPPACVEALTAFGARLSARNDGLTAEEQRALDDLVADAFGLSASQRARIARDAAKW